MIYTKSREFNDIYKENDTNLMIYTKSREFNDICKENDTNYIAKDFSFKEIFRL